MMGGCEKTADIAEDVADGVTVVVPQYGQVERTVLCCETLLNWHDGETRIIVVDDGSGEAERERARRELPGCVRWIEQEHRGVTAVWNRGLAAVRTRYVVLLNNDVISTGRWLDEMRAWLDENPERLVGAERYRASSLVKLQRLVDVGAVGAQMLAGWCLGFALKSARRVGCFDETMSLYFSDTDWQLRWAEEFGSESLVRLASPQLRHVGRVSTGRLANRRAIWRQDRDRFVGKWLRVES